MAERSPGIMRSMLFAFVASALVFGLSEGMLRLILDKEELLFSWEKQDGLIVVLPSGDVFARPNSTDTYLDGPFKWGYQTNSEGFRENKEIPFKRPKDTLRILALGDSWTFSVTAPQGKSVSAQLEKLLPEQLGGRKVEVINAGVLGACAFDMLRFWKHISARYELDGVLIAEPHNQERQRALTERRGSWYQQVKLPPNFDSFIYYALRRVYAPFAIPQFQLEKQQVVDETGIIDIINIAEDAKQQGLAVWSIMAPLNWPHLSAGYRAGRSKLTHQLEAIGVPLVGHRLNERSCWGWVDVNHPSPAGYKVLAQLAAKAISTGQSFPVFVDEPMCKDSGEAGPGLPGYPPAPE